MPRPPPGPKPCPMLARDSTVIYWGLGTVGATVSNRDDSPQAHFPRKSGFSQFPTPKKVAKRCGGSAKPGQKPQHALVLRSSIRGCKGSPKYPLLEGLFVPKMSVFFCRTCENRAFFRVQPSIFGLPRGGRMQGTQTHIFAPLSPSGFGGLRRFTHYNHVFGHMIAPRYGGRLPGVILHGWS